MSHLTRFAALLLPLLLLAPGTVVAQVPPYLMQWGSYGSADGQFYTPVGIAVGPTGTVYVVDSNLRRVQAFTSQGQFICKWGSQGTGPGQFSVPSTIAVDPAGKVYVQDVDATYGGKIQKFAADGTFITSWTVGRVPRVAADGAGVVYVSTQNLTSLTKFTADGAVLGYWTYPGGVGSMLPEGIAADASGNTYVADPWSQKVFKIGPSGNVLLGWGGISYPIRVAWSAGIVYAVDNPGFFRLQGPGTVNAFTEDGVPLGQWGSSGSGNGQFLNPIGIAVGPGGAVYVCDTNNSRIQVFGDIATPVVATSWSRIKALYR